MIWRQVKLGELVDNFSVRAKDVGGAEGLDFFGVSNEDGIIKTKYAAEDKAEDYKIIEKGCFAYNPYRVNVGSIGLVSDETRGLISPAYVVFKPKPKSIIPELLFKFLKSDEGLRQIIFYARGTVRQALRFEDLCNIEISIPEYKDQSSLYLKLINLQEKSNLLGAELQNQITLVKKLRQHLLQDAVQGKLVPQNKSRKLSGEPASELLKKIKAEKAKLIAEKKLKKEKELPPIKPEEIPFEIPENWVWCRLGDLSLYSEAGSSFKCEEVPVLKGEWGVIKVSAVSWDVFLEDKNKVYSKIQPDDISAKINVGDFLISRANTSELVGKSVVVKGISKNLLLSDKTIRFKFSDSISTDYVHLSNNFPKHAREYYALMGTGSSPSMKNITREHMRNLLIPLPPLAEQTRIVQKLDELMKYCDDLETSIKESQSTNEKLLQQVLREALRGDSEKNELSEIGIAAEPKVIE
ncbi:MAG: restriction endonuclease subunit S [Crocinitomicaceae bacterium]|nr:restriction endonuclease subunit S [Crocinitomicaceae bacterium]